MRYLVEERYPDAECIYLVQDNLNTHTAGALYETFSPQQARRILDRLEFHYTPKHGGWLNQAEIEISIFERGCLSHPVEDTATLQQRVHALETERNAGRATIEWQFTSRPPASSSSTSIRCSPPIGTTSRVLSTSVGVPTGGRGAGSNWEELAMDTPPRFDDTFLFWLRQRTEQAWSNGYPEYRWLPGLSEEEITSVEQTWNVQFPPDYRLFLRRLHAVGAVVPGAGRRRTHLMPVRKSKIVYNWLLDTKELRAAFAWPFAGLGFEQTVATAPKLIPITGHRYLLGEPCRAGNPVLSIYGTDIVVYGANLRRYLLVEFADLLHIERPNSVDEALKANLHLKDIPFWGGSDA